MKWNLQEHPAGDRATYTESFDGVVVQGLVRDCDGDYIYWSVKENGNVTGSGEVRRRAGHDYDWCWYEAIRQANIFISTDTHGGKHLPVILERAE